VQAHIYLWFLYNEVFSAGIMLFFIFLLFLFVLLQINFLTKTFGLHNNFNVLSYVNYLLVFFISLVILLNIFFGYLQIFIIFQNLNTLLFNDNVFLLQTTQLLIYDFFFFKFTPDLFGLLLNILALFVGYISFISLDTRIYFLHTKLLLICSFLLFCIFLYTLSNDILFFFILYESLLIPSFLIVYVLSPNRRGVQASLYFLI